MLHFSEIVFINVKPLQPGHTKMPRQERFKKISLNIGSNGKGEMGPRLPVIWHLKLQLDTIIHYGFHCVFDAWVFVFRLFYIFLAMVS